MYISHRFLRSANNVTTELKNCDQNAKLHFEIWFVLLLHKK